MLLLLPAELLQLLSPPLLHSPDDEANRDPSTPSTSCVAAHEGRELTAMLLPEVLCVVTQDGGRPLPSTRSSSLDSPTVYILNVSELLLLASFNLLSAARKSIPGLIMIAVSSMIALSLLRKSASSSAHSLAVRRDNSLTCLSAFVMT